MITYRANKSKISQNKTWAGNQLLWVKTSSYGAWRQEAKEFCDLSTDFATFASVKKIHDFVARLYHRHATGASVQSDDLTAFSTWNNIRSCRTYSWICGGAFEMPTEQRKQCACVGQKKLLLVEEKNKQPIAFSVHGSGALIGIDFHPQTAEKMAPPCMAGLDAPNCRYSRTRVSLV